MELVGRLIVDSPLSRYRNMAIDEALLRLSNLPTIRFYEWEEDDAFSLGYFQKVTEGPNNRPFVRRYTGGGLVDHSSDFTYSLVFPKEHFLSQATTTESYQAIHEAILDALLKEGYDAKLAPCCSESDSKACFEKAVKHDIVSGDKKLAGAAQRRTRGGCLHQGSILLDHFDRASIRRSLTEKFCELLQVDPPSPSSLSKGEKELSQQLEVERYSTGEWNLSR